MRMIPSRMIYSKKMNQQNSPVLVEERSNMSELTASSIRKIEDLARKGMAIKEVDGLKYMPDGFTMVKKPMAGTLKVKTLQALADYINNNVDKSADADLLIHITSPEVVEVYGYLHEDTRQRESLIAASTHYPGFDFGTWVGQEQFVIGLHSMFMQDDNIADIIKLAGSLTDEAVKISEDDGITQRATAKAGISRVENVEVKGRHKLKPHRTFMEVDQPASEFIFRIRSGAAQGPPALALFEADSGAWKIEAIKEISVWLKDKIKSENVTILS